MIRTFALVFILIFIPTTYCWAAKDGQLGASSTGEATITLVIPPEEEGEKEEETIEMQDSVIIIEYPAWQ